jgi:hypothetical protein
MLTLQQRSEALALEASCGNDELTVVLDDGRTVSVPLAWFPRLLQASAKRRKEWELIGGGIGIHWEAIDEDISVASLLQPEKFIRMANPAMTPTPIRTPSRRGGFRRRAKSRPVGVGDWHKVSGDTLSNSVSQLYSCAQRVSAAQIHIR